MIWSVIDTELGPPEAQRLMAAGWEPFAVTEAGCGGEHRGPRLWLRMAEPEPAAPSFGPCWDMPVPATKPPEAPTRWAVFERPGGMFLCTAAALEKPGFGEHLRAQGYSGDPIDFFETVKRDLDEAGEVARARKRERDLAALVVVSTPPEEKAPEASGDG